MFPAAHEPARARRRHGHCSNGVEDAWPSSGGRIMSRSSSARIALGSVLLALLCSACMPQGAVNPTYADEDETDDYPPGAVAKTGVPAGQVALPTAPKQLSASEVQAQLLADHQRLEKALV